MSKILCVTAHPDDEAANFGGTVARYSAQHVRCQLICLTAGAAARNRGTAQNDEELQRLRRAELDASCRLLGFEHHEAWDLPDAHLPEALFYETTGKLIAAIRNFRPDLVLCMGPEGSATAHPDHAMSGLLATAAFHWAAHERYFPGAGGEPFQPCRLYYSTAAMQPPQFPRVWLPHPDVSVAVDVERKLAAFRCHATQAPLFERVATFFRMAGDHELFHLAAGMPLPETGSCDDLFAGLDHA